MSFHKQDYNRKSLPKPIALTPDQLHQIAAGTAGVLPGIPLVPVIAGPFPIGPIWETPIGVVGVVGVV
jgi:hypothetical protein